MIIRSNTLAFNASRINSFVTNALGKSTQKLSSGYRINIAADDAAGLSISEKMRAQINGLNRATQNAEEGISFIQTTEGAANETEAILQRMRTLSVQAANGTNQNKDRDKIQNEISELIKEVDRIATDTQFNKINTFDVGGQSPFSLRKNNPHLINNSSDIVFSFNGGIQSTQTVNGDSVIYTGNTLELANTVKKYAENAADKILETFSALKNASSNNKIGLNIDNIDGNNGVLASAVLSMSYGTNSVGDNFTNMQYKLNVDSSDFVPGSYSKNDLSATLSHEMMHMVMYDTLTSGMLGSNQYPLWFIEGAAQVTGEV